MQGERSPREMQIERLNDACAVPRGVGVNRDPAPFWQSQAWLDHPLGKFGYRRQASKLHECWLILTGRISLHRAWQAGYDDHIREESARRAMGGR